MSLKEMIYDCFKFTDKIIVIYESFAGSEYCKFLQETKHIEDDNGGYCTIHLNINGKKCLIYDFPKCSVPHKIQEKVHVEIEYKNGVWKLKGRLIEIPI